MREARCEWCNEPFTTKARGPLPRFCGVDHRREARRAAGIERGDAHVEGQPVSARTYRYHYCRCPGCTTAASRTTSADRQARGGALIKVQNRCQQKATAWVRANYPALWEQFIAEAYDELGIERRKPGRYRSAPDQSSET